MLLVESKLKVADNSGIYSVKCLKFLKGSKNNSQGSIGNIVVVSLFDYKNFKQISNKKVYLGVIISIKKWLRRKTGIYVRSNENRVILLDNFERFLGKRIKGACLFWSK